MHFSSGCGFAEGEAATAIMNVDKTKREPE